MKPLIAFTILSIFHCTLNSVQGQLWVPAGRGYDGGLQDSSFSLLGMGRLQPSDSVLFQIVMGRCKGSSLLLMKKGAIVAVPVVRVPAVTAVPPIKHSPLLKVHGNVLYDMNYRSNVDTPYMERDIYQHTVQTYLDITYKDNYPLRVYFTTRFSNSRLFKNFSDINLQFSPEEFNNRIKDRLKLRVKQFISMDSLLALRRSFEKRFNAYTAMKRNMESAGNLQRMVELKERELYGRKPSSNIPTVQTTALAKQLAMEAIDVNQFKFSKRGMGNDSMDIAAMDTANKKMEHAEAMYSRQQKALDSLAKQLEQAQQAYEKGKLWVKGNSDDLTNEVDGINNYSQLKKVMRKLDMPDSSLPKGYKTLSSVKSFSLGRGMADYSELSAKNISISGLQVEYNPNWYYAVAVGSINYRFRDLVVQDAHQPQQYMALVRVGRGLKDGNNIIATFFTGRRQLYNYSTGSNGSQPDYQLMGYTVEANYQLDKNNRVTAEVAKSSIPFYSLDRTKDERMLSTAFKLKDHSNEAYSIKFSSFLPGTKTTITGNYKKLGANFQSFSVFTSGSAQSAWSLKASQPFFQRKLTVTGSVRANDFTNPFVNQGYSSTTVFKSLQATLHLKKFPVVSLGYFPSSQLTKLGDNNFSENLFYTLTATASHYYKSGHHLMNSSLVYTRFYNKGSDSGFVYFNASNLLLSQGIFLDRWTLQGNISLASNTEYQLYVIDNSFQYKLSKVFSLGAGYKYNKQTVFNRELWGYSGTAILKLPKVGEFQLVADNGFLPGGNKQLVQNKSGRITYFKIF